MMHAEPKPREMAAPRVTWIMPVRNGMPYLPETLASIEAQTFRDSEILVWDNGSDDGTIEELHRWIPTRLTGEVITGNPLSIGASLAAMVERSRTEYVARIDADDINLPERLEKQIAFLDSHPEFAMVGCQMRQINEEGADQGPFIHIPSDPCEIVHRLIGGCILSHPNQTFRRDAVLSVGNYRDLRQVEDYDLWLRLVARYQITTMEETLVRYRVHSRSATQRLLARQVLKGIEDDVLRYNMPTLLGTTPEAAAQLVARSHEAPLDAITQIAAHLDTTQQSHNRTRMRDAIFLEMCCQRFLNPFDLRSRLTLAWASKNSSFCKKELRHAANVLRAKVALGRLLRGRRSGAPASQA